MSRRKDLFENADLEKVAELVQLAKGTRTQLQFHIDSGISVSYLNQIINKQIKTPPSPKMLQSIANCSNGVDFEELLRVAGYNPEIYIHSKTVNNTGNFDIDTKHDKHLAFASITATLCSNNKIKWSHVCYGNNVEDGSYDLGIKIENNGTFNKWMFETILEAEPIVEFLERLEKTSYFPDLPKEATFGKYSYVTWSESIFNKLLEVSCENVHYFYTVILVDIVNCCVLKEQYINRTDLSDNEDYKSLNL